MINKPSTPTVFAGRVESQTDRFLSLGIDMAERRCLVAGAGRIGARKVLTLVGAGAEVIVVSPEASDDVQRLAFAGRVGWQKRRYERRDLDGMFLVVAATSDPQLNLAIGRDARKLGILNCVASSAADSDVIFPAIHAAGSVTIAVHTDGRDCRRAKQMRDAIGRWLSRAERSPEHAAMKAGRAHVFPAVDAPNPSSPDDGDTVS